MLKIYDPVISENTRPFPFSLSLTAYIILLAVNLRYTKQNTLNFTTSFEVLYKDSQFSHKQLVLVATPVSTGVYFFIYCLVL